MTNRSLAWVAVGCASLALYWQARAHAGELGPGIRVQRVNSESHTPVEARRAPEQTYLTYPEWFLVYSPNEYADLIARGAPSDFPFLGHIGQFWQGYRSIYFATKDQYPFNSEYHVMILVIGLSTTVEYGLKGAYESLVGRVTEIGMAHQTAEDALAARVARQYVDFLDVEPWYKFDFLGKLRELWTTTGFWGPNLLRKWERKYFLTTEYLAKAAYGWAIGKSSQSAYGVPESVTSILVNRQPDATAALAGWKLLKVNVDGSVLANVPRYQAFTTYARALAAEGVSFLEIAGNSDRIVVSAIVPASFDISGLAVVMTQPILTRPGTERLLFTVRVPDLSATIRRLDRPGIVLEHIYDY